VVAPRLEATSSVSYKIEWLFLIVYVKAQQAFTQLLQAIDVSEPKGAWQYYDISQVVARVVGIYRYKYILDVKGIYILKCGRNPQILQQSETLLQRALEIDPTNTDYLIEGGYQALMANKMNDAIKFYKTAGKTQAENMAAVYG
jgi:hypothetical protein